MIVDWISEPHFFLYENLLVQYIGTDETILQKLQEICGTQIAGAAVTAEEKALHDIRVSMRVLEDSISDRGFTIELENTGAIELAYGEDYSLRYNLDGAWRPVQGPDAVNDLAYILPAGERRQQQITYTKLAMGNYEICKTVWAAQQTENSENFVARAEFIVE